MCYAIPRFRMALFVIGCLAGTVNAGSYTLSGQLGTDTGAPTGLAGGSFDGTYSVSGLPVPSGGRIYLDSFDLEFKNSTGQTEFSFTSAGGDIAVIDGNFVGSGRDLMSFEKSGGNLPNLQLVFTSPFDGTGQAIPTDHRNDDAISILFFETSRGVNITSGTSSPLVSSVPEPSSLALTGFGALLGVFVRFLRHRKLSAT